MSEPPSRPEVLRPVWVGATSSFAILHEAAPEGRLGVLICSPFGWDEVSSYRMRYEWAQRLAASGIPTLRFDWPGTGDSAGLPSDPGRLARWCEAFAEAAAALRTVSAVDAVAAIAIGLGGLVAVEAIRRGADVGHLALWGPPRDGREFVRGERAFGRMQNPDQGGEEPSASDDGRIQSGGFLLSAELCADLKKVDLRSGARRLRRVLLLDRDGITLPGDVVDGLRDQGTDVSLASGSGYGEFVHRADTSHLPEGVVSAVGRWLAEVPIPDPADPVAHVPAIRRACDLVDGTELAMWLPVQRGRAFVVVTVPTTPRPGAPTLVLLPAWAIRRSGPQRMWTEVARLACSEGYTTVRVDLAGIGDSDGSRDWLRYHGNVGDPAVVAEIRQVLDGVAAAGLGTHFAACGLSSGGFWAFRTMLEDPRVQSATVINTNAPLLEPAWYAAVMRRRALAALRPRLWFDLLRGEISLRQSKILIYLRQRVARGRSAPAQGAAPASLIESLDGLQDRRAHLTLALSANEDMWRELRERGHRGDLLARPYVTLVDLSGRDHNLRSLAAQADVRRAVLEHLRRVTTAAEAENDADAGRVVDPAP